MNSIKIEINKITRNHIILKSSNNLIKTNNHVKKKIATPTKSTNGKTTTTNIKKKVIFADELGLKLVEIRSFSTNHDNFFGNGDWSFYNSLNFNFDYDDGVCEDVEDYADDDDKGIEILTNFNQLLSFNEIKNLQIHGENGDQVLIEVKDVIPENYQYYFIPDNCAESGGRKIYNKIKVRRDFNKEVNCDGSPIVQLEQLNLSSQLPQQGSESDGGHSQPTPSPSTESSNLNGIIKVTKYISSANKTTLLSLLGRLEKCEKYHLKVLEARLINTENKIQIRFISGENQECNTSSTEVFARWTKNNWSSQQDVKSIYKESLLEIGVKSSAQQYSSAHIQDVMDDEIKSTISQIFQKHNKDILNNLSFTCNFIENENHFIKSLDFNSVICEDYFEFQIPFLQLTTSSTETEVTTTNTNTNSYDNFPNSKLYNLYNDRTEVVPLKLALCFKNSTHEIWDNNYGKDYSTAISISYTSNNNNNNNNNNNVENTINFNNGGGGHFDNNYNNSYDNFYENMSMAYY